MKLTGIPQEYSRIHSKCRRQDLPQLLTLAPGMMTTETTDIEHSWKLALSDPLYLIAFASSGDHEVLEEELDDPLVVAMINAPITDTGVCPLHAAVRSGHAECVRVLCKRGAAVDLPMSGGYSPLHIATNLGLVDCVRALCEADADVDQTANNGTTSLMEATCRGHVDCLRILLEAGAQVDFALRGHFTPLYAGAHRGHFECVRLLSSYGAKRDDHAVRYAAGGGHTLLRDWLMLSRDWGPLHHLEVCLPHEPPSSKVTLRPCTDEPRT